MQARWIVLATALLLASPIAAQDSASVELTQKDVTSSVEVKGGGSVEIGLAVNLTADNFTCSSEVELPVNVTAEPSLPSSAPENASLSVQNATKAFPVPAGPRTEAYTAEANATLTAEAGSGLRENTSATVTVESSFPGANYSSCVPMEFSPATSSPAEVKVDLIADNPPEPETDEDEETEEPTDNSTVQGNETTEPPTQNTTNTNASDEGPTGVPFPWQATPLGAILAALLLRRGEQGS